MSYRTPPAVLPSLRDFPAEVKAISDDIDPIDRAFLASRGEDSIAREYPALAAALDDAVRARMAEIRAAAAPCPAFAVGPDLRGPRSPRPPRDLRA